MFHTKVVKKVKHISCSKTLLDKNKNLLIIKCVLIFSTTLSETFVLRIIQRDINVRRPYLRYPLLFSDLNQILIFSLDFRWILQSKILWQSVQWEPRCSMQTDGQMNGQTDMTNFFIDTNLIHNFLYKLHKIKFLYLFRASSAHLQEVNDVNCTCMQPLVFSFSAGCRLVHLLRGDWSSLSKCTRRPPAENENTRGCIHVQLTSLTSWRWADDARNM